MRGTSATRNLIREDKVAQMYSVIQTGQTIGMQTMDQCLQGLAERRIITVEAAPEKAREPDNITLPSLLFVEPGGQYDGRGFVIDWLGCEIAIVAGRQRGRLCLTTGEPLVDQRDDTLIPALDLARELHHSLAYVAF